MHICPYCDRHNDEILCERADCPSNMPTYKIMRIYKDRNRDREEIKSGLTLEEAKEHCQDPETSGDGWFDAFYEE